MSADLKPCPFCGGKARLSFKDVEFVGQNYRGDKKTRYRFQVICNRCHSRGAAIKTDALLNCNPWTSRYSGRGSYREDQTEMVRPWAEKAIEAWNRRTNDEP